MLYYPEVRDIFIDGTERPAQRPRNSKLQKKRYSGKKKRHRRKNVIISDDNKRIPVVSPRRDGKIHDFRQLLNTGVLQSIPPDKTIWVDKGYGGIKNKVKDESRVMIPKKKPLGRELTREEKEENKVISGIRILIEYVLGGIKRFRSVTDVFRGRFGFDDQLMLVTSGLWNSHLSCSR